MAFYSLSDRDVLAMPVTRFWLLNRTIDRISAEKSITTAMIAAQVQSADGFSELMTGLQRQLGKVAEVDHAAVAQNAQLDRGGLHALKSMGKVF